MNNDNRRRIPEMALVLWYQGLTGPQIVKRLGVVDGARFQADSVRKHIRAARKVGDPRAVKR